MRRISALIAFALFSSYAVAGTEFRYFVQVVPHPGYDYAIAYEDCSINKDGNRLTMVCDEAHPDPIFEVHNPKPEIKDLDIGTMFNTYRYKGSCKEVGDNGTVLVLACDDTIFKSGFGPKKTSEY